MKNKILFFILAIIIIIISIVIIKMVKGDIEMNSVNNENTESFNFETKTVKLNSGYEMPMLGLGTWTQNDEETANSVYYALEDGYRLIDTAQYYGNEKGVGDGLRRAINDGIAENYDIFDFELSEDDMNNIANINRNQRYENW